MTQLTAEKIMTHFRGNFIAHFDVTKPIRRSIESHEI